MKRNRAAALRRRIEEAASIEARLSALRFATSPADRENVDRIRRERLAAEAELATLENASPWGPSLPLFGGQQP